MIFPILLLKLEFIELEHFLLTLNAYTFIHNGLLTFSNYFTSKSIIVDKYHQYTMLNIQLLNYSFEF